MAGFNALTSPLTFANAQATYNSMKAPAAAPAAARSTSPAPAATGGSAPAPAGGGSTYSAPAYDYAAAAAAKARAQAKADYNSAKNTTYSSINDAIGDTGTKLNSSVLDYLDSLRTGQAGIDRTAVQNELSRISGRLGVLDMIGTGIRSGGVMLNNKGATNSSAGEALAKAYNTIGQKQISGVNNQYETGLGDIQTQQDALNLQTQQFQRHYGEQKQSAVNSIVQDASSKLAALNAAAQNASLSERIDIEQQKAAIRNQALAALGSYDATLNNGVAGITASGTDANRAKASSMLQAGVAPDQAFDYTTSAPAQWANTGPFSSPLQVFAPTKRDDQQTLGV